MTRASSPEKAGSRARAQGLFPSEAEIATL